MLENQCHGGAQRTSSKQQLPPAFSRTQPTKTCTSQRAESHHGPCKMESGCLGLGSWSRWEGGHCCGAAASLRKGGCLGFALVAWPSF